MKKNLGVRVARSVYFLVAQMLIRKVERGSFTYRTDGSPTPACDTKHWPDPVVHFSSFSNLRTQNISQICDHYLPAMELPHASRFCVHPFVVFLIFLAQCFDKAHQCKKKNIFDDFTSVLNCRHTLTYLPQFKSKKVQLFFEISAVEKAARSERWRLVSVSMVVFLGF